MNEFLRKVLGIAMSILCMAIISCAGPSSSVQDEKENEDGGTSISITFPSTTTTSSAKVADSE